LVLGLGADLALDYTLTNVIDAVNDADVIELAGGDTCIQMLKTLRKSSFLVSAKKLPSFEEIQEATKLGVRGSWFLVEPDGAGLERLPALIQRSSFKN
jgi:hypothetical protein